MPKCVNTLYVCTLYVDIWGCMSACECVYECIEDENVVTMSACM